MPIWNLTNMCLNPITRRVSTNPNTPIYSVQVPCGKCLECLKKYQNDWSIRIFEHLQSVGLGLFVTLTYRENVTYRDFKKTYPYACKNLPLPPQQCVPRVIDKTTGETYRTVYKKHIQNCFKRFRQYRKKKGLDNPFSYFLTAEYGPRTARPHYHMIVFGLKYNEFLPFLHDWSYRFGNYRCDIVSFGKKSHFNVSRYLAKYCSKGVFENPLVKQKKVLKCFKLISKKLGYSYVINRKDEHLGFNRFKDLFSSDRISHIVDRMYYKYMGTDSVTGRSVEFRYSLPKYYKEHIFGSKNLLRYKMYLEICKRNDALYLQQLQQIQSQWNCSDVQAVRIMDLQSLRDTVFKEKELRTKLARYYDTSKL